MKTFFLALFMTFFFNQPKNLAVDVPTPEKDLCRMTCTIYMDDGFGGYIGISATAGGWFTSCEDAFVNACVKVSKMAMDMAANLE